MTTWLALITLGLLGAITVGQRDHHRDVRLVEESRIAAPLPPARVELTEPWPERQTPTDLAAEYLPVHWSPAVAPTPLNYQGRHEAHRVAGDVTQEFWAIVSGRYEPEVSA